MKHFSENIFLSNFKFPFFFHCQACLKVTRNSSGDFTTFKSEGKEKKEVERGSEIKRKTGVQRKREGDIERAKENGRGRDIERGRNMWIEEDRGRKG